MSQSLLSAVHLPYESADEVRRQNAHLIEELDARVGSDSRPETEAAALRDLEPQIREFLGRGSAAGAFVDDIRERTACQVLLDYWTSTLSHAGIPAERQRLAPFDAERLPDLKDKPCPFVGLEAFRSGAFFFGRQKAIDSLVARVADNPLVVVQGASGTGKSSLVIAGALPVLSGERHEPRFQVIGPFTPGNAVLENLMRAVAAATGKAVQTEKEAAALRIDVRTLAAKLPDGTSPPALLVIDQFEEVFTLCPERDAMTISAALLALLEMRPADRVILTLREEFSGELNKLPSLSGYLDRAPHARFSMQEWRMGAADLKAAIEGPAALVNLQFARGIVDEMVESVVGLDTALPLLQFALRALWEHRDRNRVTREVYDKVGTPLSALTRFADGFYDAQPFEHQEEMKRILLELLTIGRMLEAYREPRLRSIVLAEGNPRTSTVLDLLARNDFIRVTPTADGLDATVEVKHEALLRNWPLYVEWINEKRERVRRRIALTEAAERWQREGRSPAQGLLSEWQLHELEQLPDLSTLERDYLQASSDAIDRTKREHEDELLRRQKRKLFARGLAGVTACVIVLAVAAAWYSHLLKEVSNVQAGIARTKEASYLGEVDHTLTGALQTMTDLQALSDKPFAGWLLSRHPQARELHGQTREMLLTTLHNTSDVRRLFIGDAPVLQAVAFDPARDDGLLAYGWTDGKTYLAEITKPSALAPLETCAQVPVTAVAFDPQGRWLAAGCADGTMSVWAVDRWRKLGDNKRVLNNRVWAIAFSPDGHLVAAAGGQGKYQDVALVPLDHDGVPASPSRVGGSPRIGGVWSLAFSPAGDALLLGDGVGALFSCKADLQASWNCPPPIAAYPGPPAGSDAIDTVRALAYSADGTQIAVGHEQGGVDLWDADFSAQSRTSIDISQPGPVHSLAFLDACGRRYLAIAKADRVEYRVADPQMQGPHLPGNCAMPLAASIGDAAYGLAFHQPTGLLAAATRGGYVAVLDPSSRYVSSGSPRQLPAVSTIAPMRGAILREQESMAWLAVPIRAVGADHDNLAILTLHNGRLDNGPPLALRAAGPGEIRRLSASVQNHRLATFACATGGEASCTVTVWQYDDAFNLTPVVSLSRDEFGGLKPGRIALSADGQRLVVCFTTGNRLLTVPVAAGGKVTAIETDLQEVNEIAFSGDGANFAAGGRVSTGDMSPSADGVQLWRVNGSGFEVSRRSPLHSLPSVNRVYELGFAEDRDGNVLLLVGEQYGGIDLLDVRSGRWLPQLRGDSRSILQLAFSRHTSLVAAADSDNVVRLWDTARWTRASLDASGPIKPLELTLSTDSDQGPGFLAFGGEGTWLASGAGKLRLWDLDVDSLVRDVCARLREPGQHGAESAAPLWSKDRPCTLR